MKGRKINVRAIIFDELHRCAQNNDGSLNFPSLISALCLQAKVPLKDNEELIVNKGAITKHAVLRIRKQESNVQTPQGITSTSTTAILSTTNTLTSKTPFERQALANLNRMSQQDIALEKNIMKIYIALEKAQRNTEMLWTYIRERDDLIRKSLQQNFTKVPKFPDFLRSCMMR